MDVEQSPDISLILYSVVCHWCDDLLAWHMTGARGASELLFTYWIATC